MRHFHNYKIAVYMVAQSIEQMDMETLKKQYDFIEKYVGIDKVYLEPYRGDAWVSKEKIREISAFFKERDVEVSGGMTTLTPDLKKSDEDKQRLFGTFCYSDDLMRERLKNVSEYCSELFDEVILDDFYFTNCTCDDCIKAKGSRSWSQFRRELMKDVSKNLVVGPAKNVNPDVRMIIKFPNWRESYHATGYVPDIEKDIFDSVYTGSETRSGAYHDQHLPAYLSYSIVRWMDEASDNRNLGTWFDTYQCWPIDTYLEQGYLSAFSKPKEITLFMWTDLFENKLVTPLGLQLKRIDEILDQAGRPVGIPVYIPYSSQGENHVEDYMGMQGFALIPTPRFPDKGKVVLTESSLTDNDILKKTKGLLQKGGEVFVTPGFAKNAGEEFGDISSASFTGKKLLVNRYFKTDDAAGFMDDEKTVSFADIEHSNNMSWSLLNGGNGKYHTSLFLKDTYSKGRMYLINIPENPSDLANVPTDALDTVRAVLNYKGVYVSARNVSVFHYDNDVFILYAHVTDKAHPIHAKIHIQDENAKLFDLSWQNEIKLEKSEIQFHFNMVEELVGDAVLEPGEFYAYRIKKQDKGSENGSENAYHTGEASDKEFDWRKTC
ncbi:MAG: hypothetical protein K5921_00140 [Lachnospiraceae bacterium]|nr:hypothetical protein [Lachnospiraceae bacterium]